MGYPIISAIDARFKMNELHLAQKDMSPGARIETKVMIKLTPAERPLFKNMGYPIISAFTSELTWWVYKSDYEAVMGMKPKKPLAFDADAIQKELEDSMTDGTWTK
jgi:hypothetical protein